MSYYIVFLNWICDELSGHFVQPATCCHVEEEGKDAAPVIASPQDPPRCIKGERQHAACQLTGAPLHLLPSGDVNHLQVVLAVPHLEYRPRSEDFHRSCSASLRSQLINAAAVMFWRRKFNRWQKDFMVHLIWREKSQIKQKIKVKSTPIKMFTDLVLVSKSWHLILKFKSMSAVCATLMHYLETDKRLPSGGYFLCMYWW